MPDTPCFPLTPPFRASCSHHRDMFPAHTTVPCFLPTPPCRGCRVTVTLEAVLSGHDDKVYSAAWHPPRDSDEGDGQVRVISSLCGSVLWKWHLDTAVAAFQPLLPAALISRRGLLLLRCCGVRFCYLAVGPATLMLLWSTLV